MALLEVRHLSTRFQTDRGEFAAVDDVCLSIEAGKTLAIVGESGCGKSVTSLSIMGLAGPAAQVSADAIQFEGRDLLRLTPAQMQALRGNALAMIFQEPMSSLNPAFTVGAQIVEVLLRHRQISQHEAEALALALLERVRIPAPAQRFHEHPHRLSGGMRQRVMIAMALANSPRLLIADEPTTALDVTIQAQILDLMKSLQQDSGMAMMLITHDLGVVAEVADEVAVMYAGRIVEQATVEQLFNQPQHPYTVGLLGAMPRLDGPQARLTAIQGQVPGLFERLPGCGFATRCPFAVARCTQQTPPLRAIEGQHHAACWLAPLDVETLVPETDNARA